MAELDYGAPDEEIRGEARPDEGVAASMHAPQGGAEGMNGDSERVLAMDMLEDDAGQHAGNGERLPRFYQLPTEQGIEANSTRDVRPSNYLEEEEELLLPPEEDGE